jgi:hypothetical protein
MRSVDRGLLAGLVGDDDARQVARERRQTELDAPRWQFVELSLDGLEPRRERRFPS